MNDDYVKCAGEALIMQYALVNTDSLIGVLDIDKIQTLMEDAYSHVADYLRECDEDEYNTFFKDLDEYIKNNDVHGYLTGDTGPGRRERRFVIESLIEEMNARL